MESKSILKIFNTLMYLIFLFPIATTLVDNGVINKILFFLFSLFFLILIAKRKIKKSSIGIVMLMLVNFGFTIFNTSFPLYNVNLLFYYPFFIIYMLFSYDYYKDIKEWFITNEKFVRKIIKCWNIIVGISIFLPQCYYVKEGGEKYFGSFAKSIFRLGPAAVFIMALVLISMSLYKRKKDIIYFIVPLYSCSMGSSRTYFILSVLMFLIAWYWFFNDKRKFYFSIFIFALFIPIIFTKTSIYSKIMYTVDKNTYGEFWSKITSTRSDFWKVDINCWKKEMTVNKLFGSGLDFTYSKTGLWAHNDYLEVLCSCGIFGLITYIAVMLRYIFKKLKFNVPNVMKIITVIVWVFNAFFNMHYTYFCCVLCYPFIILALENYYQKRG